MFRRTHRVIQQGGGGPPSTAVGTPLISAVDPVTGNLLVNGAPFFMVRGDNLDYGTALGNVGYSATGWDAHLAPLKNAGLNVISANWGTILGVNPALFDGGYDNTLDVSTNLWNRFGLYVWGNALGNATGGGQCQLTPTIDYACIAAFVNGKKSRVELLLWQASGEIQSTTYPAPVWDHVYPFIQSLDPTRTRGDFILTNNVVLQSWFDQSLLACPVPEDVLTPPWPFMNSGDTGGATVNALLFDKMDAAWNGGHRFLYAHNMTLIPELDFPTTFACQFTVTSSTPITAGPNVVVTPSAMSGTNVYGIPWAITANMIVLRVDTGAPQEFVNVKSVSGATFTADFMNNHSGTYNIVGYVFGARLNPPRLQVRRAFWFMIARQCRHIGTLWGPQQRNWPYTAGGDTGLTTGSPTKTFIWNRDSPKTFFLVNTGVDGAVTDPILTPLLDNGRCPSVLDNLEYLRQVWADITSLKDVILDGQRWTTLTCNPNDTGTGSGRTGIFAVSKTVAGVTYVIAMNMKLEARTYPVGGDSFYIEIPVSTAYGNGPATITVGSGTTCVRLFEAGSPTFSGGIITDDFRPMETHVYRVT